MSASRQLINDIRIKYGKQIGKASKETGLSPVEIEAVIAQESQGNPNAKSPKGAEGLMQFMPDTWAGEKKKHGIPDNIRATDPDANILLGAHYLKELKTKYKGDMSKALMAYNWGSGNTDAYLGGKKTVIPPETRDYLSAVGSTIKQTNANDKLPIGQRPMVGYSPANPLLAEQQAVKNTSDAFKQELATKKSVDEASFTDSFRAAFTAMNLSSPTTALMDELNMRSLAEPADKNYKYNQVQASELLARAGAQYSEENLDFLTKATSTPDLLRRVDHLKGKSELENFSRQSLSEAAHTGWSVGGSIAGDPTVALSVGAIPLAVAKMGLAARAFSAYGSSIALQGAIGLVKNEYVAGYTADDAVMDALLGGVVDGALAKGVFKPKVPLATPKQVVEVRRSTMDSLVNNPVDRKYDLSQQYGWSFAPSKQLDEPFTDVEFEDAAKQLGYSQGAKLSHEGQLLIEDKNVRQQILDTANANRNKEIQAKHKDLMDEAKARKEAKVEANIAKDTAKQTAKQTAKLTARSDKYDKALANSGLSKAEFDAKLETLDNDVSEIKDLIVEASGYASSKTKERMFSDLSSMIDDISRVSPDAGQSLKATLQKASGKVYATKVAKAGLDVKVAMGAKKFDATLKQINTYVASSMAKLKRAGEDITGLKNKSVVENIGKPNFDEEVAIENLTKTINKANPKNNTTIAKQIERATKDLADLQADIAKRGEEQAKSVKAQLLQQKEIYERMASAVDELAHDMEEAVSSILIKRFANPTERQAYLDELSDAINKEFGSDIKLNFVDGKITSTGGIKFSVSGNKAMNKNSKLKLMLGAGLALSTTGLMASSGEDDDGWFSIGRVIALGIAVAIGSTSLKYILERGEIKKASETTASKMNGLEKEATIQADPLYKRIYNAATTLDTYRTGYLESLAKVVKSRSQFHRELGRKLVTDQVDPTTVSVEADKLGRVRSMEFRVADASDKAYKQWLLNTNQKDTMVVKAAHLMEDTPLRERFERETLDHIEFGTDADSAMKEYAKVIKKERDDIVKYMNEAGVDGFDTESIAGFKDTHVARLVRSGNMQNIASTEAGRVAMKNAISEMIASKIGKMSNDPKVIKMADTYVENVIKNSVGTHGVGVPDIKAMVEAMDELGLDVSGIDMDALAKETHKSNDILSRGKLRIPMDMGAFKPFNVTIDGVDTRVELHHLYERDAQQLMRRVANESFGYAAAVRITGYKSYSALVNAIQNGDGKIIPEPEVVKTMMTYADSLFARPTFDASSEMARNIMAGKAYTNIVLATSTLTTVFELMKSLSSAFGVHGSSTARKQYMLSIGNGIKSMYGGERFKDTLLSQVMTSSVNGLGGAYVRGDTMIKGIDDIINVADKELNTFRTLAKKVGNLGFMMSGLIKADDFYKKIANIHAATLLARMAHGLDEIDDGRKAMYGINDNVLKRMKEKMKLSKDEEVIDFDFDNWDQADQDMFRSITDRIVMDRSTWTTLGAIPTGSINSSAGVLLSGLTHFMAQTYTTQGIAKMKHGGALNFMDMGVWMFAGYTTYYAKSFALGREPNEEDAIRYAILSSPLATPINVTGMMMNPIALSVADRTVQAARENIEYVAKEVNE